MVSPVIEPVARLIESFARLPGIGPKTAQRLTFHLLRAQESEARTLAAALAPPPGATDSPAQRRISTGASRLMRSTLP